MLPGAKVDSLVEQQQIPVVHFKKGQRKDEVRGVQGNLLGQIDEQGNTIQFYFDAGIPNDVDDASRLRIVLMDFPQPEKKGSYTAHVTIGEVHGLIEKAFKVGADYRKFAGVTFAPW